MNSVTMKLSTVHKDTVINVCNDDFNMRDLLRLKTNSSGREYKDDPFYICNLDDVVRKYWKFQEHLPQVQPFFAVKCNPDPVIIALLAYLGVNFDCASKGEIKAVLDLGVDPERIIFANPCKQNSFIKYANEKNVKKMTFDNEAELHKIKQHFPDAELVIRIKVDDSKSSCQFGIKFGATLESAEKLLNVAKELGLNVIGVSFHVGSGCYDAALYYDAVKLSATVFEQAENLGFNFTLLDIGGGFPGAEGGKISFELTASQLNLGIEKFFPPERNVRIIAEPGRFFVASALTLTCNVTSIREVSSNKNSPPGFMYYLNDGVYGSFNCILFDHQTPTPLTLHETDNCTRYKCSLWGPTCDSMDCISKDSYLPKLSVGDWLYFENMGAYTIAPSIKFNGFKPPVVFYMCTQSMYEESMTPSDVVAAVKKCGISGICGKTGILESVVC